MRPIRRLALCAALAILGVPRSAGAEAVGSPASLLKKGKWAMGLSGGGILGRSLKGNAEAQAAQFGHYRGYGLTDRLSVYGKIGLAYLEVDDPSIVKATSREAANSFGTNLLTSVQVKARLLEHERWQAEWDGSLQYVDIRGRHQGRNDANWREWQFATSVAKGLGRLKAYLGVKYNLLHMTYKVRDQGTLVRQDAYEQDHPLGLFVGTDYALGSSEDVILNVETSFLDGPEVDVAIAYTF